MSVLVFNNSVGRASTLMAEGCGFDHRLGHTKDHYKNGRSMRPTHAWRSALINYGRLASLLSYPPGDGNVIC